MRARFKRQSVKRREAGTFPERARFMWLKLADWDEGYWDVGSRAGELKLRILWPLHVESKKTIWWSSTLAS